VCSSDLDVSDAISEAEQSRPKRKPKKATPKSAKAQRAADDAEALEADWEEFSESVVFMLAIYERGKNVIVDVLQVNGAFTTARNKVKLDVCGPKRVKDKYIGEYLDWDKDFELPLEKLLHHEPLHSEFQADTDKSDAEYQAVVKRGLKIARNL
jgi:hypothetical protein